MDEELDVKVDDTAAETHQEETDQALDDVKEEAADEPVDGAGVPLKNRQAEAERKARKARMSDSQAQDAILKQPVQGNAGSGQDEALRIVQGIAGDVVKKSLEPLLAKQFLMEHPEARDMIEELNEIRASNPEIAGVDKLELALKIAKANRMDEEIRRGVESARAKEDETLEKSKQASLEGSGRAKTPTQKGDLASQIAKAGTLEELRKLEAQLVP